MQNLKLFTPEQLDFYRTHGYVVLKNVLPQRTLDKARDVCSLWTDTKINEWIAEGHLKQNIYGDLDLDKRFMAAYLDAGKPEYRRNILFYNINPKMHDLITDEAFLDIAEDAFGTSEISVSGINNVRLKDKRLPWTYVDWHADLYYWEEFEKGNPLDFMVVWYPLHHVDKDRGGLQLISMTEIKGSDLTPPAGQMTLPDSVAEGRKVIELTMEPGDALCMCDNVLHRSSPTQVETTIWTIDNRYEATEHCSTKTKKYGLVGRSKKNPRTVTTVEEWLSKREPAPPIPPKKDATVSSAV